ncbi:hypothetical protein [Roseibium sp.]|uniref:hypothetical protein n=1 Tax=Roseibium sp. TaxID=1936156 RepID=UPI003264C1AA
MSFQQVARSGLYEETIEAPVIPASFGDTAPFRVVGEARLAFHGIDRALAGTSTLLKNDGRINLTLRRVTQPL